jgi:phage-related protein
MKNIVLIPVNYISNYQTNKQYFPIKISSNDTSFTVENGGSAPTPCKLSFSLLNDQLRMTISGLTKEPIIMKNLLRSDSVVIDGINKTITINGKISFDHFDGWEFPRLMPGLNTINMTNAGTLNLIEVEFQPRYV